MKNITCTVILLEQQNNYNPDLLSFLYTRKTWNTLWLRCKHIVAKVQGSCRKWMHVRPLVWLTPFSHWLPAWTHMTERRTTALCSSLDIHSPTQSVVCSKCPPLSTTKTVAELAFLQWQRRLLVEVHLRLDAMPIWMVEDASLNLFFACTQGC